MSKKSQESKAHLKLPRLIDVGPGHRLYKIWCDRKNLGEDVVAALAVVSAAAFELRTMNLPPMSRGLPDQLELSLDILERHLMTTVR